MMRAIALIIWIAIPFAIYFLVIKPKLYTGFFDLYKEKPFVQRWMARLYAFRTWLIGTFGMAVVFLPDTLQALLGVPGLPDWIAKYVTIATILLMIYSRAVATTPHEEPTP